MQLALLLVYLCVDAHALLVTDHQLGPWRLSSQGELRSRLFQILFKQITVPANVNRTVEVEQSWVRSTVLLELQPSTVGKLLQEVAVF